MAHVVHITAPLINKLAAPETGNKITYDDKDVGFGIRVTANGVKTFIFAYRFAKKEHRKRIGGFPTLTVEAARRKAKELRAKVDLGIDPFPQAAKTGPTVADLLDRFLDDYADKDLKPKTAKEYRRVTEKLLKKKLGHLTIKEIEPQHVAAAYQEMRDAPTQAGYAVRVLASAMARAQEWGLRPAGSNPARIKMKAMRRRERLFSDTEVGRLQKAIGTLERAGALNKPVALALRLLFATGCRAGEIIGLEWANVDLDEGWLRWPDTKTGFLIKSITDEVRPLLERADRIVGVKWVCPGIDGRPMAMQTLERGFAKVMAAAEVVANENATLHLIRHWFASKVYGDKAIPLPQAMKIVGHKSVAVALRYAHVTHEEMKEAGEGSARRRATAIKKAGDAAKAKVVPIRKGA